jgi:glycosyltransferase involved in cell wall biosynthesis
MRVGLLLLAVGRRAGGPETYEVELVRALARLDRDNQFFIYTTEDGADEAIGVHQSNVHYRRIAPRNRWLALSFGLRLQMRHDHIDLLHCTYAPPLFASRHVFTMHCVSNLRHPEFYGRFKAARLNALQRRGLQTATEVLCVSGFVRAELAAHYHLPPDRSCVVYNGVDPLFNSTPQPGAMRYLHERYGIRKPYVLYVGKLQSRKNIPRLIAAYNIFRKREGTDLQLVLAGRRTEDAGLDAALRNSPYAADILELGYIAPPGPNGRSDLPTLYRSARLFAFPSLFEGFGFPIVESMACGTPVLTSATTSLPEIAHDAAQLVDPYSVEEIADGMVRLHCCEELRTGLIQKGLVRSSHFTWDLCARSTLAAYQRACSAS